MKRLTLTLGVAVIAAIAAACSGGTQQTPATENAPAASSPAAGQQVDITLKTAPDPPKMGETTFDVMVIAGGQPVTDADVSVELFMAAMPSMNMAEMRSSVPLKHEGGGRYLGAGNVMMAGNWDATVSVKRAGQELGNRKVAIAAQ